MKIHKAFNILLIVVLLLTGFSASPSSTRAQGADEESLDQMKTFSVLANLGAESLGITQIEGNLGIAVEGAEALGDWQVGGEKHIGPDSLAGTALEEAIRLNARLAEKACDTTVASDKNTLTTFVLIPGVTCFEGETVFLNELMLENKQEKEAEFLIRAAGDIIFSEDSRVSLTEPKSVESIYWQIAGSLIAGERSQLQGTFLVASGIETGLQTDVTGRLISLEGSVMTKESKLHFKADQPTPEPPIEPTEVPIPQPTLEPTLEPTELPTPEPTVEPTPLPTELPTTEPTVEPTQEPTEQPTPEPTTEPTQVPTMLPTPTPEIKLAEVITPEGGDLVPDHYTVVLKTDYSAKQNEQEIELAITARGGSIVYFYEYKFNGYLANLPPETLAIVRADPSVEYLEAVALQNGQTLDTEVISPYFAIKHSTSSDGTRLTEALINGPSTPPQGLSPSQQMSSEAIVLGSLSNFPSYSWVFGCSAVSGSMISAYYDRNGYSNVYTGPTNGGVMPITDTSWPEWWDGYDTYPSNPLIASKQGLEGRTTRGSIDDYWIKYLSPDPDPYISGGWTQHAWGTAVGDYMKTSQSAYGTLDGGTRFKYWSDGTKMQCSEMPPYDGMLGLKQFFEARGYAVSTCYSQKTDNVVSGGFTLANYKSEIDAGRPVLIHVTGHSMVGFGYSGSTIYIRNTWDSDPSNVYSMTWGESYQDMELFAVGVLRLAPISPIPFQVSPIGTITDVTPTYTWTVVPGATKYMYQVVQGSTVIYTNIVSSTVCDGSTCSSTPSPQLGGGDYSWRVKSYVGAWKNYSVWKAFKVKTIPTVVAPKGLTPATSPTYKWSAIHSASQYNFQVVKGTTLMYSLTIGKSQCDSTICSYNTSKLLSDGAYQWRVRSYIGGAWKKFSPWTSFTVAAQPGLVAPVGVITDTTPTYTWKIVPDASKYALQLIKDGTQVYYKVVSTAGCGTNTCSSTPSSVLGYGTYTWRARAYVGTAWRTYSANKTFTLKAPVGFNSQFNGSKPYWSWKAGGTWQVSSSYMYTNGMGDSFSSVYRNTAKFENFDYSARVKRVGGGDLFFQPANYLAVRMGTGVNAEDKNKWYPGYLFGITSGRLYSENYASFAIFEANSDGSYTNIQPWTMSSAIKLNDWNVLRVVANGGAFRFYINGTLVYAFTDYTYSKGYVGFEMYKMYGYTTQFQVDWATLSIVNPTLLTEVISSEQEALNQAALLNSTPSSIEGRYVNPE